LERKKKMKNKNPGRDFLSIKEFAKLVGITVVSLRNYDRKGIFNPAKRGIEGNNRYRYYSPVQITTVKMLRVLTEIGVPLKTIKELIEIRTPEKIIKLLCKNKDRVASEIRYLQEVHAVINTFTDLLNEAISVDETELTVSEMPEKRIIWGDINDFHGETGFMREFLRFCETPREPKLRTSFPIGGYWENMTEFLNEPSRPIRFFTIDPEGYEKKAAGLYLTGYTRGYYGQTNDLPEQMVAYAKKKGLIFNGPVYNIYLIDEISEVDPERYLLQVSASVSETRRVPSRRPRRQYEHE
jgi:DNA-binding transcriptional MerR regulator